MNSHPQVVTNLHIASVESLCLMASSSEAPTGDPEGWIRVKLQAGLPLDPEEEAYLASLPPTDPLLRLRPVARRNAA